MEKETIIGKLEAHIESECQAIDTDGLYDEMLDECYSFEKVGGPFEHMLPSRALAESDPTAYRCGKIDWVDSMRNEWVEVGGDYYDRRDAENAKEAFIDELRLQQGTLESDIEELEADEDRSVQEVAKMKRDLSELEKDIETAEGHDL